MEQLWLFELQERRDNIVPSPSVPSGSRQALCHIAKSPFELLDSVNWDFTGEVTQYLTHTFHSYPARFIPQIPNMFIQLFTSEGDMVLDPFVGCGTTLVEAMLLNRKAIGVDMNPLACLISKTKTTLVSQRDLYRLWDTVVRMQDIFGVLREDDVEYLTQAGAFDNTDMKFPNRKISELAPDAGFVLKKLLFRNIDIKRKYHNQEVGKIDNEYIIVLQKVANPPTTADDDDFIARVVRREMLKFKEQVDKSPGSSLRGKRVRFAHQRLRLMVSVERLKQNPKRLEAAIATIRKDVRLK